MTAVDLAPSTHEPEPPLPTPDSDSPPGSEAGSTYPSHRSYTTSEPILPQMPHTAHIDGAHSAPEPAGDTNSPHLSHFPSRASSIAFPSSTEHSDDFGDQPSTPVPSNPRVAEIRNERRYRLTLQHEYHPSRKLSLTLARNSG